MNEKTKRGAYYYIAPMLITVIIILITYILKGVYPFGESDIAYNDMSASYVSIYSRNYEILHGNDSLFFDWEMGAGIDTASTFQEYSLHPINWLTYWIHPNDMLHFMAVFLLIKLMIASAGMSLYLKKLYDLPLLMHTALCVMYTFSGYVVQYYTNIMFIDSLMTLPFLMLSLIHMHRTGKQLPYMLLTALQLLTQPYLGFMTLMFILFYSFGLMFLCGEKQERKVFAARLGLSTFAGIAISAVTVLPAIYKWTTLSRVKEFGKFDVFSLLDIFARWELDFMNIKLFLAFNTELAVAVMILAVVSVFIRGKRISRHLAVRLYIFGITLMPLLNEGTNLLWSLGSYNHFPYRVGYIYTFAACELIAYFCLHEDEIQSITVNKRTLRIAAYIISAGLAAAGFTLAALMGGGMWNKAISPDTSSYYNDKYVYIIEIIFFVCLLLFFSKRARETVASLFIILQSAIMTVCFIAPPEENVDYIVLDSSIPKIADIRSNAGLENDGVSRIKLLNPTLVMNYAQLLGIPSTEQWVSESSNEYVSEMERLGYFKRYTLNADNGGTLFSDALMNDKYVIVYAPDEVYVPEQLYEKRANAGEYAVYDMKYTLPFGLITDERLLDTDGEEESAAQHQMRIAAAFEDPQQPLFTQLDADDSLLPEDSEYPELEPYRFKLHFDHPSVVYFNCNGSAFVFADGERIKVPIYNDTDNTDITKDEAPSLILVRAYGAGEDTEIVVESSVKTFELLVLDLDAMDALRGKYENSCAQTYKAGKNSLEMTADAHGTGYMFLPLEYYEGWSADVNGQPADIIPVMNGAFMAVKLPDGHCEIKMTYIPRYFKTGACVTAAGIVLSALMLIMKKRGRDISATRIMSGAAYVIFSAVAVGGLILVYILPVLL